MNVYYIGENVNIYILYFYLFKYILTYAVIICIKSNVGNLTFIYSLLEWFLLFNNVWYLYGTNRISC